MILARLSQLADCVCSTIAEEGLPGFCFCGLVPGEIMADMYGGDCAGDCTAEANGYAWVRMVSMYPAAAVGAAKTAVDNCDGPLGIDVEVGSIRCFPVDGTGSPPTAKELLDLTALQIEDALAMRKAISCCFGRGEVLLASYAPYGPQGGQFGGTWTLSLAGDF